MFIYSLRYQCPFVYLIFQLAPFDKKYRTNKEKYTPTDQATIFGSGNRNGPKNNLTYTPAKRIKTTVAA